MAQQDGERVSRELRRLALSRAAVVGVLIGLAVFLVILPFWLWRLSAWVDQAPILHASRTNLLGDASAQNLFFWAEYGPLPAVFGFAVAGLLRRRTAALAALLALLVVLGLGGTTALPRWLYGPMWDWLTYDRFAFWGTLVALPFAGQAAAWWRCRRSAAGRAWVSAAIPALFLATFVVYSLGAATNGLVSPSEPKPVDLDPIAAFLHEEGRAAWRYLTFGLGDQAARLNYRTAAQTIDGSYHTARRLPALTASGIGQVDYALWWEPGGRTLDRILDEARARNVRWAFVNERPYAGYLARHGWIARGRLSNQVEVWELSGVEPVPPPPPRPVELPALLWGTLPLAAAAAAVALAGICRVHASCVSPSTRGGRACGHTRQHRSPALGGE
ncbi:MAG: hypothetical protein HY331_15515 [Chloroflexi bacterium]|nr:hypothetical protein [Chloroflexota bacterium]